MVYWRPRPWFGAFLPSFCYGGNLSYDGNLEEVPNVILVGLRLSPFEEDAQSGRIRVLQIDPAAVDG